MSGRWWRAYSRARHDPKLLKLSDKHFRWWFSLVCVAADNDGTLPPHDDLAVEFRTSGKTMTAVLNALIAAGLFDHDETGIHPHNWDGLQYKSDGSAERMRRHRERQRSVTCDVTVTPSESETETETDSSEAKASAADAAQTDPTKIAFDAGVKILTAAGKSEPAARKLIGGWRKEHSDEAVIEAIGKVQLAHASEPISFIVACLKQRHKAREGPPPHKRGEADWN